MTPAGAPPWSDAIFPVDPYEPIFVARQPIFDRDRAVWGYKLLFRASPDAASAVIEDPDLATAQVIADGFPLALTGLDESKHILVSVPNTMLRKEAILALPPAVAIPQLEDVGKPDARTLAACQALKKVGYAIATPIPSFDSLLKLADIIILNILGRKEAEVTRVVQQLQRYPAKLLAQKIEDKASFELAHTLGFSLFQGFYFSKPEIVPGRKLTPTATAKLQLIHELSKDGFEVDALTRIISSDPSLSFRLLKFINSVAFSLKTTVTSIQQAIALLGQRPLKQWLMAVTLSDLNTDPSAEAHYVISIQRARFMELLTEHMADPPFSKDTMLLIGLFSNLDVLLGQSMQEIVEQFPLEEHIKRVLTRQDTTNAEWLTLAESVEQGEWEAVEHIIHRHNISIKDAAVSYNLSSLWANELISSAMAGGR